jgi:hypothetical protein
MVMMAMLLVMVVVMSTVMVSLTSLAGHPR